MKRGCTQAASTRHQRPFVDDQQEAVDLFDELIVAVGYNPDKHYLLRRRTRRHAARNHPPIRNLRVESFENRFHRWTAPNPWAPITLLRGIRTASDYEFRRTMRYVNSTCTRTSPPSSCCRRAVCRGVVHHGQRPGRPQGLGGGDSPIRTGPGACEKLLQLSPQTALKAHSLKSAQQPWFGARPQTTGTYNNAKGLCQPR